MSTSRSVLRGAEHRRYLWMLPLLAATAFGCGETGGTFDNELAVAYTEVVIAEAMHPADSVAWRTAVIPHLEGTGYETPEEVHAAIRELAATDSRAFTALMDTVQMRLDRIRSGTDEPAD